MDSPAFCQHCGTPVPPVALVCPACQRLVFATELRQMADRAAACEGVQNWREARSIYEQMLTLLPPETSQYASVASKLRTIPNPDAAQDSTAHPQHGKGWRNLVSGLGVAGALAWKFKALVLLALTKGKLLLLGLTKLPTLFSMFASVGVYWALYGWRYAVGLVLSIYVHEMGHMFAFRRFGIPASAPMFIPGLGALIRSQAPIHSLEEGARIGLAGPWWGLGAALAFQAAYWYTDARWLSAVAHTGAVINLFNLLPVFGLDGDHAFRVLSRLKRVLLLASVLILWYLSGETMFFVVSLGVAWRCFSKDYPEREDPAIFWQTLALLAALGLLCSTTAHWDRTLLVG